MTFEFLIYAIQYANQDRNEAFKKEKFEISFIQLHWLIENDSVLRFLDPYFDPAATKVYFLWDKNLILIRSTGIRGQGEPFAK